MSNNIDKFLEFLENHKEDRGMMSDLRRGMSPTTEHYAWPHIAGWCELKNEKERRIYQIISAGFAIHKTTCSKGNLGTTFQQIATGKGKGNDGLKTFEAKFRRFLSCDSSEELCEMLPSVIKAAEHKECQINFRQLFWDLTCWDNDRKVEWASEFWGSKGQEAE